jgi:putative inorganic carbon (hco3(-)) transporter
MEYEYLPNKELWAVQYLVCILLCMALGSFARKSIIILFHTLLFTVPLAFTWVNEELFEFPKMLLVYAFTIAIVALWLIRMIAEKRWLITKTALDIPLALFVASQVLSTVFSIHPRTSLLGYYTRFHGGLLSTISYVLLYYAFVSNVSRKQIKSFLMTLVVSSLIVSAYAIPEHFGHSPSCTLISGAFDVSCWVQDVKSRVFGTFGQPNWLAAYTITLLPLTLILASVSKGLRKVLFATTTVCLLLALLFTRSRSGFAGFGISTVVLMVGYSLLLFQKHGLILKKWFDGQSKTMVGLLVSLMATVFFFGSPFTKPLSGYISQTDTQETLVTPTSTGPAVNRLEEGGTDSGEIRKIVWDGAIKIWQRYPLFGSGVETFAYSYYQDRPMAHNTVSEWDFLYNKAHNEFLNFLATTGLIGLGAYVLLLTWFSLVALRFLLKKTNTSPKNETDKRIVLALLSGIAALTVSNFFGFSTVMVTVLLFLYFGIFIVIKDAPVDNFELNRTTSAGRYFACAVVLIVAFVLFGRVNNVWVADKKYTLGKSYLQAGYAIQGVQFLQEAVEIAPKEALFRDELSNTYAQLAIAYTEQKQSTQAAELTTAALTEIAQTLTLNSRHLNFHKSQVRVFITLSQLNPSFLSRAKQAIDVAVELAPTDAKLVYNQGAILLAMNQTTEAIVALEKAVAMKPNYEAARLELAKLYELHNRPADALVQYTYIIEHITPNNELAKQKIEELTNQ